MRVRRLLHETTSRLELAALQKADAVVDRLTFNATIIEPSQTRQELARAIAEAPPLKGTHANIPL